MFRLKGGGGGVKDDKQLSCSIVSYLPEWVEDGDFFLFCIINKTKMSKYKAARWSRTASVTNARAVM